jgi:hypothetical protein
MRWFGHLLATRPMAFWSGIWVSTFLIGVVAFGSLLSPSASERRSVSAIALGSDSGVATQPIENQGKVPLWMFGAIAVTCTAGSILVSRQLKPGAAVSPVAPARRRRQKRRSQPVVSTQSQRRRKVAKARKKVSPRQPQRLKPYSPEALFAPSVHPPIPGPPAIAPPPIQPRVAGSLSFVVAKASVRAEQQAVQSAKPVPVTVVPAEHSHPLDWTEPCLADDLDLRKRKPIQSWL